MKTCCFGDALGFSSIRVKIVIVISLCAAFSTAAWAQQYTISTIVGNGTANFSGDGGAAASATLNGPNGVALDGSLNLYIADVGNERIRVVSGGTISTFAGNGTVGYGGDGSPAIDAELYS